MQDQGTWEELGPQHPGDSVFTARMRFHQSWYRARILNLPFGLGPARSSNSCYGNMLTWRDGNHGHNFLNPHIETVARERLNQKQGTVDEFRLLCNLLSSQPMCFNLFAPLKTDIELVTLLFQSIYPHEVGHVDRVEFEYAPEPRSKFLNDRTAFDAFIEFTRTNGGKAFIGIETKLTEPFSISAPFSDRYKDWTEKEFAPWIPSSLGMLRRKQFNQLWRDHMLAVAMRHQKDSPYTYGHFLVVYHSLDQSCSHSINQYQNYLKPGDDSFSAMDLDQLVRIWMQSAPDDQTRLWLEHFRHDI